MVSVSGQCPSPHSTDVSPRSESLSLPTLEHCLVQPAPCGASVCSASSATHCLLTTCSPKYLFWPGRQPHRPELSLVGRSPPLSRPMRGRILIKLCGREGLSLTLWQTPFNLSLLAIATLLLHQRSSFSQGISTKQKNGQKQENVAQKSFEAII